MFLTQFESTAEKTRSYLEALSIGEAGRLLFLLYDGQERLVGHMGISNVNGQCGELDNVLRGVAGGEPRLVYFAEVTLLDWCFANLGLAESDLRLLSYNWMAASLHEEVGYKVVEKSFLRKYEKEGVTFHEPVDESLANVKYACLRMRLTKADFYARNGLH